MNAYLFTAGFTRTRITPTPSRGGQMVNMPQTYDGTVSAIVHGGNPEQAQKRFEAWCHPAADSEDPAIVKIKKIVVAQFVDELLAEAGGSPPDWPQISKQVDDALQATALDDFEQGYWVDANEAVPPGTTSPDIESLQRDLPDDIRSSLNWSPDKKFFFLVSVFSPRTTPVIPDDDGESNPPDVQNPDEENQEVEGLDLEEAVAARDELRDKEAAVLVVARNSVAAAWLWRKYAAQTRLAENHIKIDPCCAFVPVE
jgi:hypothetical protein